MSICINLRPIESMFKLSLGYNRLIMTADISLR